jgi:hypothetical protein
MWKMGRPSNQTGSISIPEGLGGAIASEILGIGGTCPHTRGRDSPPPEKAIVPKAIVTAIDAPLLAQIPILNTSAKLLILSRTTP